ncbi:universal stress protein [Variovorax ureilyticus]|uniref:Universal stress protein n=1 Tax=Variovorax ureilyticus TaxID=1836198 RepID=A0ABU8VKZ7_9BURK
MYQHILVPIDDTSVSERGLHEAILLAAALKSRLRLLHVIDDFQAQVDQSPESTFDAAVQEVRRKAEALLATAQKSALESGISAECVLIDAVPTTVSDLILQEAQSRKCDLIVMGTHARHGLIRLVFGSDADLIVRGSLVPVLLVRSS